MYDIFKARVLYRLSHLSLLIRRPQACPPPCRAAARVGCRVGSRLQRPPAAPDRPVRSTSTSLALGAVHPRIRSDFLDSALPAHSRQGRTWTCAPYIARQAQLRIHTNDVQSNYLCVRLRSFHVCTNENTSAAFPIDEDL